MRKNPAQRGTLGQYSHRGVPFTVYYTPLRHTWCYDIRAVRDVHPLAGIGVLKCESTSAAAAVLSAKIHIDRLIQGTPANTNVGTNISIIYNSFFMELRPEQKVQDGTILTGRILRATPKFVAVEFLPERRVVIERWYFDKHAKDASTTSVKRVGESIVKEIDPQEAVKMVRFYVEDHLREYQMVDWPIPLGNGSWGVYVRPRKGGKPEYIRVSHKEVERAWKARGLSENPVMENPIPDVVRAGMLMLSMVFVGTGVYFIAKAVDPLMPKPKEQYPVFGQDWTYTYYA